MSETCLILRVVGLSKYGSFDFNKIEADGEIEFSEASLPMVKEKEVWLDASRHLKLLLQWHLP